MNKLPDFIFDFVELYAFNELRSEEQQRVLLHLTAADYQMLYEGAQAAKQFSAHQPFQIQSRHQQLLAALPQPQINTRHALQIWRAAAVVFLCLHLVFLYQWMSYAKPDKQVVVKRDTIYMPQSPVVQTLRDTLFVAATSAQPEIPSLSRRIAQNSHLNLSKRSRRVIPVRVLQQAPLYSSDESIRVLRVSDQSSASQPQHHTIDELSRQIGFSKIKATENEVSSSFIP